MDKLLFTLLPIHNGHDNNPADNQGFTPLQIAAQTGHLDIYKLIIDQVENKNPTDKDGTTPLSCPVKSL